MDVRSFLGKPDSGGGQASNDFDRLDLAPAYTRSAMTGRVLSGRRPGCCRDYDELVDLANESLFSWLQENRLKAGVQHRLSACA